MTPALHITNLNTHQLTQTHKPFPPTKESDTKIRLDSDRLDWSNSPGFFFGAVRPIKTRSAMTKNIMSYQLEHRHILTVSALMHICPKGLALSSIGLPGSSVIVSPTSFYLFLFLFLRRRSPNPGLGRMEGLDLEKPGNPWIPPDARDLQIVVGQTPLRRGVAKNLRS